MQVLFAGDLHVAYSQAYVQSKPEPSPQLDEAFAGQMNGLCGAAWPGFLCLATGLHSGRVGFRVELHDSEPPVDDAWEDVVEVSFLPAGEPVALAEWPGASVSVLEVPQAHLRARYCAHGMDEGRAADTRLDGMPELDRYLLQFWPAASAPDRVLKQTSACATYAQQYARTLSPPPTPQERAGRQMKVEREAEARRRQFEIDLNWGGVPPSERLENLRANIVGLVKLDRALADALARAEPAVQRDIARWAARRACDAAGVSVLDWVARGLEALDRGDPLQAPFDDDAMLSEVLLGKDVVLEAVVADNTRPTENIWLPAAAVSALLSAVGPDPLVAAVDTLYAAAVTFGDDYSLLFQQLRAAFPQLR